MGRTARTQQFQSLVIWGAVLGLSHNLNMLSSLSKEEEIYSRPLPPGEELLSAINQFRVSEEQTANTNNLAQSYGKSCFLSK